MDNPEKLATSGRQHTRRRQTKQKANISVCLSYLEKEYTWLFLFLNVKFSIYL